MLDEIRRGGESMPKKQSVSDTVGWLSFPQNAYPNFYLSADRIQKRFHSYLGSIREFGAAVEKSGEASASVNALFAQAGFKGGLGGSNDIRWDLGEALPQVLVLRAYLTTMADLHSDARSAPVTDFVLARGQGGIVQPHDVADRSLWNRGRISPDVVAEIAKEQKRQATYEGQDDDHKHLLWAAYANTDQGLVVSLLGDASVIGADVRPYAWLDLTYCIFGQKVRDWQSWTLLQPLHVWVEPPGKPSWG
jgi:hypothetical protein